MASDRAKMERGFRKEAAKRLNKVKFPKTQTPDYQPDPEEAEQEGDQEDLMYPKQEA